MLMCTVIVVGMTLGQTPSTKDIVAERAIRRIVAAQVSA
jgi:hypothetical protein